MPSTYSHDVANPLNAARLLLGDTGADGGVFLLSDEEILGMLASAPFNEAVARLAEALAARFAQYPDETTTPGGIRERWGERVRTWMELASRMRAVYGGRRAAAVLGQLREPSGGRYGRRGLR
jgi:hypothetical protein